MHNKFAKSWGARDTVHAGHGAHAEARFPNGLGHRFGALGHVGELDHQESESAEQARRPSSGRPGKIAKSWRFGKYH